MSEKLIIEENALGVISLMCIGGATSGRLRSFLAHSKRSDRHIGSVFYFMLIGSGFSDKDLVTVGVSHWEALWPLTH